MLVSARSTAITAARKAGSIALSKYRNGFTKTEKARSDLVTETDVAAEKAIVAILSRKFPDHSIIGEEQTNIESNSDYKWYIDPLDGTNNYAHHFPFWCVSIALYHKDKPQLGVVYDPLRNHLFYAEKGKGAFLNNKNISVSTTKKLRQSLLVTGFYYDRGTLMKKTLKQMELFFKKHVHGVRRTGSAALDQCYVAAGYLDGFWELTLNPWDFAAGVLIIQEAGGKVTDIAGKPYSIHQRDICASNGNIHKEMLAVIKK